MAGPRYFKVIFGFNTLGHRIKIGFQSTFISFSTLRFIMTSLTSATLILYFRPFKYHHIILFIHNFIRPLPIRIST